MTEKEVQQKLQQIQDFFEISGDSPSDPIARKPSQDQLNWSARVASAQEKMVRDRNLDSVSYYYHGRDDYFETVQSGFIVVGADAHSPEKISFAFDKAAKVLSDCGFRYYTVFKNRKPEFIRLS